jgi:hypothetical protein
MHNAPPHLAKLWHGRPGFFEPPNPLGMPNLHQQNANKVKINPISRETFISPNMAITQQILPPVPDQWVPVGPHAFSLKVPLTVANGTRTILGKMSPGYATLFVETIKIVPATLFHGEQQDKALKVIYKEYHSYPSSDYEIWERNFMLKALTQVSQLQSMQYEEDNNVQVS